MIINRTSYPDGSFYTTVDGQPNFPIMFRVNSYEDLWALNQFVDAYNHQYGGEPIIYIPNLIDAQADRRFNNNESSGLKLVLEFLKTMNAKFEFFHPHNPEVVEAVLGDKVFKIRDNQRFISYVLSDIRNSDKKTYPDILDDEYIGPEGYFRDSRLDENIIMMSADAGGFKPLSKLCDKLEWQGEIYSASKSRKYEDGKSKLTQVIDRTDFGGKDILIVDDLCVYGGTFKGLATLLRERNVGKLYLAVSHMTIQNHRDAELFILFDTVFTTNSKYPNYYVPNRNGNGGYQPGNLIINGV